MSDEFYVGYQPQAPPSLRNTIRLTLAGLTVAFAGFLALALFGQPPFGQGRFGFGEYRDYQGTLIEWPYPMLLTNDGPYLLVGEGKFGVAGEVAGHDGDRARLQGALIERGAQRMLEVKAGSLHVVKAGQADTIQAADLGRVTLTGEIVDTKCHLGVMKPGEGKVHRECAARCISGGAPPGFLVRDASGETRLLLLTGADGRALNRELLDYVAEPITIPGQLVRQGSALVLKAEPQHFRRE